MAKRRDTQKRQPGVQTRQPGSSTRQPGEQAQSPQGRHAKKSRYVPALDGLRTFAVLAVIFYHMDLGWAPGGLMGVTVFFVISGYLINGLLVSEREDTGSISLKAFWMRRIRRLFPAIFLSVVGTAALCTLFNHTLLDKMRPDIIPSLLFYNNWWQIFRDVSYFEAAGAPSPLTHFWSLSIEEQFYVIWPLLLLLMYRIGWKKQRMSRVVLVLALLSAIEMALLYTPTADPSRIYYGTDTRAMSLLIGVWLAFVWPSAAFGRNPEVGKRDRTTWIAFNVIGVIALIGLVAIIAFTEGFSSFPYYGGIAVTTLLSAALIAVLAVPDTWLSKVFALKPLVWIGKRSYGMYLWHLPILLLTTNPNSTVATPWWMHVVQLGLIIGVAALSYTFIEDPIRKGKLGEWWRNHANGANVHVGNSFKTSAMPSARNASRKQERASNGKGNVVKNTTGNEWKMPRGNARMGRARVVIPACYFAGLLVVAAVGVFVVRPTDYASQYAGQGAAASANSSSERNGESRGQTGSSATSATSNNSSSGTSAASSQASSSKSSNSTYNKIFNEQHFNSAGKPIYEPLLIGDSVAAGAVDAFYETFPYGHIDAEVNRNIWESPYPTYRDEGKVGDYVVICLGTNNAVVDWQIDDELLSSVESDKKVFMVNTRNTQAWLQSTNAEIASAPERHSNVTMIDWYAASARHDEYFAGDGTHLTDAGAHAYMDLIRSSIEKSLS